MLKSPASHLVTCVFCCQEVLLCLKSTHFQAMTALETQSSRDLFKSSGGDNPGLRQRRDKEQMVTEYSNVTDNLTAISRQLAETVERSKLTVGNFL